MDRQEDSSYAVPPHQHQHLYQHHYFENWPWCREAMGCGCPVRSNHMVDEDFMGFPWSSRPTERMGEVKTAVRTTCRARFYCVSVTMRFLAFPFMIARNNRTMSWYWRSPRMLALALVVRILMSAAFAFAWSHVAPSHCTPGRHVQTHPSYFCRTNWFEDLMVM